VGNTVLRTDARNFATSYTLDALNRTVGQLYPNGTMVTNTFDAAGQQITQQDSTGIRSFSWDQDGRQIGVVDPTGMTLTYTLDPVGNRLLLQDPNAGLTSYSWDAQNRLTSIVNPFAERTTVSFDALDRELQKTLGNGMAVSHSYDSAGRETVLGNYSSSGAALAVFTSTFDAMDNRLTVLEVNSSLTTYGYDPSYQLVTEQRSGSSAFNASVVYDPVGNRLVANASGAITTSSYNAANELVLLTPASGQATSSSYDANGNLTVENVGGSLTSYSWDYENRLIGVAYPTGQPQTFGYAANGQRTQVINAGSTLAHDLWDGDNLLLSTNTSLVTQVHYTDNPGYWGGLVSQNQSGVTSFYGFDGPGNTRILVSSAGSVLATYLYEAFGLEIVTPSASNVYWFGGQYGYQRDVANRYYVRARHLETANGRWVSKTPDAFNAAGWSLYIYRWNDPLGRSIPSRSTFVMTPHSVLINSNSDPYATLIASAQATLVDASQPLCYGGDGTCKVRDVRAVKSKQKRKCDDNPILPDKGPCGVKVQYDYLNVIPCHDGNCMGCKLLTESVRVVGGDCGLASSIIGIKCLIDPMTCKLMDCHDEYAICMIGGIKEQLSCFQIFEQTLKVDGINVVVCTITIKVQINSKGICTGKVTRGPCHSLVEC